MIGTRIKEERERLGMTIPEFAAAAGAGKNTVIDWQNGASTPKAQQLSALAEVGVDVLYVITGERTRALLSHREAALLDNYRNSSDEAKAALEKTSAALAQPKDMSTKRTRKGGA